MKSVDKRVRVGSVTECPLCEGDDKPDDHLLIDETERFGASGRTAIALEWRCPMGHRWVELWQRARIEYRKR